MRQSGGGLDGITIPLALYGSDFQHNEVARSNALTRRKIAVAAFTDCGVASTCITNEWMMQIKSLIVTKPETATFFGQRPIVEGPDHRGDTRQSIRSMRESTGTMSVDPVISLKKCFSPYAALTDGGTPPKVCALKQRHRIRESTRFDVVGAE
jgi:hypothetical protein